MSNMFSIKDLESKGHTVKTDNGEVWVNLGNNKFVNRETLKKKRVQICSAGLLYTRAKSVMYDNKLIAIRSGNKKMLTKLEVPKVIKNVI